jgi:hypothetical protein
MKVVHLILVLASSVLATPCAWGDDALPPPEIRVRRAVPLETDVPSSQPRLERKMVPNLRDVELPPGTVRLQVPSARRGSVVGSSDLGYTPGWEVAPFAGRRIVTPGPPPPLAVSLNDKLYLTRRRSIVGDALPLLGDKLKEAGIAFPLPIGISFNYNFSELKSKVTDLQVGLNGAPLRDISFLEIAPFTTVRSYGGRIDAWLLPFVNVFFLGGYTESVSTTTVTFDRLLPGRPTTTVELPLERSGPTYGGGLVLAGGYEWFFASGTFTWTETQLGEGASSITARIGSVRVGWRGDLPRGAKIQLWGVATYWDTARELEGDVVLDTGDRLQFKLFQGPITDWTFGGGLRIDYRGMLEVLFEFTAFQDRTSLTLGATARF